MKNQIKPILLGFILVGYCFSTTYGQKTDAIYIGQKHRHFINEYAQTQESLVISYNEKMVLSEENLKDLKHATWAFGNGDELLKSNQEGSTLKDYVFSIPGEYTLSIDMATAYLETQNGTCFHPSLPGTILLKVVPYQLTFDVESVIISAPIKAGKETSGTQLQINVYLTSFNGLGLEYDQELKTAGIRTSIKGKTVGNVHLTPGINRLVFDLEGKVEQSNTFISFDFTDVATGNIISYALPYAIN
ncbi:MAG: hypothetical protein WAT79_03910 [Saprospiraceae bacterium]